MRLTRTFPHQAGSNDFVRSTFDGDGFNFLLGLADFLLPPLSFRFDSCFVGVTGSSAVADVEAK